MFEATSITNSRDMVLVVHQEEKGDKFQLHQQEPSGKPKCHEFFNLNPSLHLIFGLKDLASCYIMNGVHVITWTVIKLVICQKVR